MIIDVPAVFIVFSTIIDILVSTCIVQILSFQSLRLKSKLYTECNVCSREKVVAEQLFEL